MQIPLNLTLMREPYNWLTVALMLAIASFFLTLLLEGGHSFAHDSGSADAGGVL